MQHEGKKELIVYAEGTRYTVDFGRLAKQLTGLMAAFVRIMTGIPRQTANRPAIRRSQKVGGCFHSSSCMCAGIGVETQSCPTRNLSSA